jgi:hypothetical protein
MTTHRLINIALTAALTAAMATILSTGHLLDDHSADWSESTALRDAQQQAQAVERRNRAAQQLCIRLHGPGVAAAWDADDRLVCSARRGPARTVVAKGGAL